VYALKNISSPKSVGVSFAAPRALGNYIKSLKWDDKK
jgi:hypothetical protein